MGSFGAKLPACSAAFVQVSWGIAGKRFIQGGGRFFSATSNLSIQVKSNQKMKN
jgi:hypothetical protein